MMTDRQIVAEIIAGNKELYQELVDRYYTGLYCHLNFMLKDSDMADDICQEVFVKSYVNIKKYNPEYAFSTWLYKIGTNLALDQLRKKHAIPLDYIPEIQSPDNLTEKAIKKQRAELVREQISKLPLQYQMVISLRYWQALDYATIARVMSVPVGTIKTWLNRAKNKLKEGLDGKV